MSEDLQTTKGPTKRNQPGGKGSNPQLVPLLGVVKDNVDPTRAGRIFVYLANNSGLDPENRSNWRPVKYLSPFFGFTRGDAATDNYGNFKNNPSSYGMWTSPPDIGTTVLCLFVNGDLNYGFYIGCVPEPESMQMVPAIGSVDNVVPNKGEAQSYGGALRLPVTNINKNNKAIADTADYLKAAKPIHSYSSSIMFQQGVLRDPIRGPISSSSQRETPSRVGWGVSTPGRPIYEGGFDDTSIASNLDKSKDKQLRIISRRGGHSIVMDDGDIIGRDNLVRIRTSLGHQILMSDDGQTLMILHSNGQSYVELGKEGTVDIYSTNSINLRTQGDLNLHADNDVNIHATKNLNLQGDNIHINSEKEFKLRVGTDYTSSAGGKHTTKVAGAMSMDSAGDISMASSAQAYVNGSKVLLNSGQTSTKPAEVAAIEKVLHTDTLFDEQKGFLAAPAKLVSITSRAPAHAPWSNAGQGVDLKTDLNASSQLPASPSTSVAETNETAASAGISNPVSASTVASMPVNNPASKAIDTNMTKAVTGQIATNAVTGPLSNAVSKGTAIVGNSAVTVGIGQFAQTPQQLETAGIIKPGSAALVTSIAATTGNIQAAMPTNLFTGKPGAENLNSLVQNVQAQAESVVTNLTKAQTSLQNAGAIAGNESGTQISGLVMSTAQNGLNPTLGAIKGSVSQLGGGISGALGAGAGSLKGKVDGVMKDISGGNFAAKIGEAGAGALGGLSGSLESMIKSPTLNDVINQTAGISAGAFSAIASSMKPLQAGIPQNLSAIAKESAVNTVATSAASATNPLNQASNSLSSFAKNGLAGVKNAAGGLLSSSAADALGSTTSKLTSALPNAKSVADSLIGAANKQLGDVTSSVTNAATELTGSSTLASSAAGAFGNATDLIKNPTKAVDSLVGSAKTIASGLTSSGAGSFASGLTNLPGGAGAVSSITNLAKGNLPNLPGTSNLKNAIQGKATDLLNNIGSSIGSKAGDLLSKAGGAGGLASLLPKGLPAGAAAELQSALGSIAAGGSGIKIPSIGLNTTDRSSITSAVTSQLDDPGIPAPKFGEVDEGAKTQVESLEQQRTELLLKTSDAAAEYTKALTKRDKAQKKLDKARKKLPQGDPGIASAQEEYNAAYYEAEEKQEKFQALYREQEEKYGSSGPFG